MTVDRAKRLATGDLVWYVRNTGTQLLDILVGQVRHTTATDVVVKWDHQNGRSVFGLGADEWRWAIIFADDRRLAGAAGAAGEAQGAGD